MTEVFTRGNSTPQSPRQSDATHLDAESLGGWRCVWLPRHGVFLAYMDTDVPPGLPRPAVYGKTADETLAAIHRHRELANLVREWIHLHPGEPT